MTTPTAERFTKQRIRQTKHDGTVKIRELAVPSLETMQRQHSMLKTLYSIGVPMLHATACLPGKTLRDNVLPHQANNHFFKVDLKDAFPSVAIDSLLRTVKPPIVPEQHKAGVRDFIIDWATTPLVPGLPLGAPASPFLFNMACLPLDTELGSYCDYNGITYTRYLDDLTFSSTRPLGKSVRKRLRTAIEDHPGATINHAKSQLHDLTRGPITITGVSLYPDRHIGATPSLIEAASDTYKTIGGYAMSGGLIFDDDIGKLHGYFGAVEQVSDENAMITHRLYREYRAALGSLGIEGGGRK